MNPYDAIAIGFGALCLGLYIGEQGRRKTAERLLGIIPPAGVKPTSRRYGKEAEDRFLEAAEQVSEETVDRVAQDLLREAQARQIEGYTEEQAREDARQLLAGHDVTA